MNTWLSTQFDYDPTWFWYRPQAQKLERTSLAHKNMAHVLL
jgi:hypothetical protein